MRRHHHLYLSILVPSISVLVGSTAYAQGTTETVLKVHRPGGETGWGIALFLDIDGENVGYLNRNDSKEFKLKSLDKGARTLHGAYWAYGFLTNDFGSRDLEAGEAHLICVEIGYDADNKKVFDVVETLAIELDDELKGVVTKKSPVYKLARGTEKTVEDTIRVTHSVTITDRKSVEGGLQAKSSVIEAGIKGGIERSTSRTFQTESEAKRSVRLVGDGSAMQRVVWVKLYRTGTATLRINGATKRFHFEFEEDFDLLTEEAN